MVDAIPRLHVALEGRNRYSPLYPFQTVSTPRQEGALCSVSVPKGGVVLITGHTFDLKTCCGPHLGKGDEVYQHERCG